jgi:hypothetical protein
MLRPALLLTAEVAAIYVLLVVLGAWITRLLRLHWTEHSTPLTAVLGLAALQSVTWYASTFDVGLDQVITVLVIVSVVALAATAVFEGWRPVRALFAIRHGRAATIDALTAAASFVVFLVHQDDLLSRGTLSISSPNNDVAAYVAVADHLRHAGFATVGSISGVDLGHVARTDVYGAYSFLTGARWVLDRPGFQLALAGLAVATILVAQSLGRLLGRWTAMPVPLVVGVAVLPQTTFLFSYVTAMYFLSQLLGLAFAVVMVDVATQRDTERADSGWRFHLAQVLALAGLSAGLVLTYPHMVFLLPPIVAAVVAVQHGRRWRAAVHSLVLYSAGVALGLIVMLPRTIVAVDRLLYLSGVKAGWPLAGVLPIGLLGEQESFDGTVSAFTIVASVLVIGVSLAASWRLVRRGEGDSWIGPAVVLLAGSMVSYAAFYFLRGGPTYEQWKWISFLQPLVVAMIVAPVLAWAHRRFGSMGARAAGALLVVLVVANMNRSVPFSSEIGRSTNFVSLELGTLGDDPALADVDEVNIDLSPYWESMWAANAVAPRTAFIQALTYYAPAGPAAEWTLTTPPSNLDVSASPDVRFVDGGAYVLVRQPEGATSRLVEGLAVQLAVKVTDSVDPASPGHVSLTIVNEGSATLLGSGGTTGAVNVGVEILDDRGTVTNREYARAVLIRSPFSIEPGATTTTEFDLPALPTGVHRLRFDLVAEGVAWFGDIGASTPVVVVVEAP